MRFRYASLLVLAVATAALCSAADSPTITVAPGASKQVTPVAASVRLAGAEFEILTVSGWKGEVVWDVGSFEGSNPPVKLFELKAKESVVGVRSGTLIPDRHESPETPSVAVFAVGTGRASVVAWGVRDNRPVKLGTFPVEAGLGPRPPPVPPDPKPPDPKPPEPDSLLVGRFRDALSVDMAMGQGTKEKASALAVVFESGAGLLDLNDPAIAPKTVGELYTKMVNASVAKGIPRLPYLKNVRAVIEANTPVKNGTTELTPALKKEYQAAYRTVAAALAEAAK